MPSRLINLRLHKPISPILGGILTQQKFAVLMFFYSRKASEWWSCLFANNWWMKVQVKIIKWLTHMVKNNYLSRFKTVTISVLDKFCNEKDKQYCTAKRKLERLQISTSSSFVKIWSACSCEFKAYFWTFWALYHMLFDLETIGVN